MLLIVFVVLGVVIEEDCNCKGVGVDVVGEGNGECCDCCCCKDTGCGWGINWVFIIFKGSVNEENKKKQEK